jgi:peptidoglycan/xylan/chitin deacetylase (PgdA/CDA1 family)
MSHPLIDADARANLCFHDFADDPSWIYTLPMRYLLTVAERLRAEGIADRVRIYFDDGYASVLEAVRTLQERFPEIESIAALTLGFLGQPGHIDWPAIDTLHAAGVGIAGHGREHLHMDELTDEQVLVQLVASRDALLSYGGDEFVFPSGSFNDRVLTLNERHELFRVLTTVDYGWDRGQPLRPRLMVTSQITPAEVIARLADPD